MPIQREPGSYELPHVDILIGLKERGTSDAREFPFQMLVTGSVTEHEKLCNPAGCCALHVSHKLHWRVTDALTIHAYTSKSVLSTGMHRHVPEVPTVTPVGNGMSGLMPGDVLKTRLMVEISCRHSNGPVILAPIA